MKYRWKLLVLLMLISILPIIGLRTFGIHNVHRMADELTRQMQESQVKDARSRMLQWIDSCRQTLEIKREQVEMALVQQAIDMRRNLEPKVPEKDFTNDPAQFIRIERPSTRHPPLGESEFLQSNTTLCIVYPEEPPPSPAKADALRLAESQLVFQGIDLHLGTLSLRHYSGLANGAAVIYPCNRKADRDIGDPRRSTWYRSAYTEKFSIWSAPYVDPESGKRVMAASMPLERENDQIYGVTSILVPVETLMEASVLVSGLPAEARIFLTHLAKQPASGTAGLEILFQTDKNSSGATSTEPLENWLASDDSVQMNHLLRDIAARRTNLIRMPFEGRDCFWAYGPLYRQGTAFVFVVPSDQVIAPSRQLQTALESRVHRVEIYTGAFLLALILINTLLALLFSRSVTRPLHSLVDAARELSAGNFASRVEIDRRDEFGDLGRVFNQLGPRLKDHFRMQQALNVAMEIQQTLLPLEPPRIDGLDIHAVTRYSDKTGGDFFDYLCVGEGGRQRLCVAVGDVSDHGIPSALLMATARALLRYRADAAGSVGKIVTDVNAKFSDDVESSGRFITLFLARIDRVHHRIEWVRAGHDPALLYDPETDAFQSLQGDGIPLGVEAGYRYGESASGARPGQILFIGTDGIWETRNREDTFFGKDRLCEVIRRHADAPAAHITRAIINAVAQFRGPEHQEDDLTALVVKFESVRSQP